MERSQDLCSRWATTGQHTVWRGVLRLVLKTELERLWWRTIQREFQICATEKKTALPPCHFLLKVGIWKVYHLKKNQGPRTVVVLGKFSQVLRGSANDSDDLITETHYFIGSQCNGLRIGLACSALRDLRKSLVHRFVPVGERELQYGLLCHHSAYTHMCCWRHSAYTSHVLLKALTTEKVSGTCWRHSSQTRYSVSADITHHRQDVLYLLTSLMTDKVSWHRSPQTIFPVPADVTHQRQSVLYLLTSVTIHNVSGTC